MCVCNNFHQLAVLCITVYRSNDDETVIGPLTADSDIEQQQPLSDANTTEPVEPVEPSGPFIYRFQLWAR